MTFEPLPGTTNVYRFPVEDRARPSIDLLRRLQPDLRELALAAEAHRLAPPPPLLRDTLEAEATTVAATHAATLSDLVAERIAAAVEACRRARRASAQTDATERRLTEATAAGGYYLQPLRLRAAEAARTATTLALAAHHAAEAAEALLRAERRVASGESLLPLDRRAEAKALFFGDARA